LEILRKAMPMGRSNICHPHLVTNSQAESAKPKQPSHHQSAVCIQTLLDYDMWQIAL
jgi:hypothetical protein